MLNAFGRGNTSAYFSTQLRIVLSNYFGNVLTRNSETDVRAPIPPKREVLVDDNFAGEYSTIQASILFLENL